jgi:hypothetical protein
MENGYRLVRARGLHTVPSTPPFAKIVTADNRTSASSLFENMPGQTWRYVED